MGEVNSGGPGMICKGREKKTRLHGKISYLMLGPRLVSDTPFRLMLWSEAQLGESGHLHV